MRQSFEHVHKVMRQNNGLSVKDFRKQFNVLDTMRNLDLSLRINFKWCLQKTVSLLFISETQSESTPESDETGYVIEEIVDFVKQLNLEVDNIDS